MPCDRFDAVQARLSDLEMTELAKIPTWSPSDPSIRNRIRPGWIARVYDANGGERGRFAKHDMGVFVLDETRFHLATHRYHDIDSPETASYKLNELFRVIDGGLHQGRLGVSFSGPVNGNAPRCRISLRVGGEVLFEESLAFRQIGRERFRLVGEGRYDPGLYPPQACVVCEYVPSAKEPASGQHIELSWTHRAPGEQAFRARRDGFVHLSDDVEKPLDQDVTDASDIQATGTDEFTMGHEKS